MALLLGMLSPLGIAGGREAIWDKAATDAISSAPIGTSYTVPFHLHQGYLVLLKGKIASLDDLTFLIDTGATTTFWSSGIAGKLNLKGGSGYATAFGTPISTEVVILRELSIGPIPFQGIPAAIADLSPLSAFAVGVDAIVGLNVLKRSGFNIDFEARTIAFGPVSHFQSGSAFDDLDSMIVRVSIDGQPLKLMVDTAAKEILIYRHVANQLQSMKSAWEEKTVQHLGGSQQAYAVEPVVLRIGET